MEEPNLSREVFHAPFVPGKNCDSDSSASFQFQFGHSRNSGTFTKLPINSSLQKQFVVPRGNARLLLKLSRNWENTSCRQQTRHGMMRNAPTIPHTLSFQQLSVSTFVQVQSDSAFIVMTRCTTPDTLMRPVQDGHLVETTASASSSLVSEPPLRTELQE